MAFEIYDASVPVLISSLTALSKFLAKGAAHAEAKGFKPEALLQARLAPDMNALPSQIQTASDAAKGLGARLAGVEIPSMPDTETTFPELQARIEKTIAFLKGLDRAAFAGADTKEIVMKVGPNEWKMSGAQYLTTFALPNFFFHVTIAYALLRHNGVEIGKRDFLGG
jgi:hypothetical protein